MIIRWPVRMCQPVSESRKSLLPPLNTNKQKNSVSTAISVAMSGNATGTVAFATSAAAVLGSAGANARQARRDAGIQADDGGGELIYGGNQRQAYGRHNERVLHQVLPLLVFWQFCQPYK